MSTTYGYKRTVVGAHYGWRDFLVQRITAIVLTVFTLLVLLQLLLVKGPIGYDAWAAIFAPQWMKALTFSVIVALIWHAWIGACSIWVDYIKPAGTRLVVQSLTALWLISCGAWAVQVLWRI